MANVRFTRRCFEEDLERLPRRIASEALDAAETLEASPEIGDQLDPPLERFRRLRLAGRYRLVYTHDTDSDIWWVCLVWERRPGRAADVYEVLRSLVESLELK